MFWSTDDKWATLGGTEDFDATVWPLVEFESPFMPKSHPPDTPVTILRLGDDLEKAEAERAPDEQRGRRPTYGISMPGATQVGLNQALASLPPRAKFPAKAAGYDPPSVAPGLTASRDPRDGLESVELFLKPGLDGQGLLRLLDALEPLVSAAGGIGDGERPSKDAPRSGSTRRQRSACTRNWPQPWKRRDCLPAAKPCCTTPSATRSEA